MNNYDLCIAWNWEHDADFAAMLEFACQRRSVSLLQVTPANLISICQALRCGELGFRYLLDRASDADPEFMPLPLWAAHHGTFSINPYLQSRRAWDKATMHQEFLVVGLPVPESIVLPPFHEQTDLPSVHLGPLGSSFSIKPACRGGGEGVVNEATSLVEVLAARQQFPEDRYLLQARIVPARVGPRYAWFRVIFCKDQVFTCWWDVQTHVYEPVQGGEYTERAFERLAAVAQQIAEICGLGLFSTEIALTQSGDLVAVDYVNDPLDLRLQSKAVDGVPDVIVRAVADRLAHVVSPGCSLPSSTHS